MFDWPLGICFLLFGLVGFRLGWKALKQYQSMFVDDPANTMTFEVFFRIIGFGGPGYLIALAFCLATFMSFVGLLFIALSILNGLSQHVPVH